MAKSRPILTSKTPIVTDGEWTRRFNKIFKRRHYGGLKNDSHDNQNK